jgi:hypothetical protein
MIFFFEKPTPLEEVLNFFFRRIESTELFHSIFFVSLFFFSASTCGKCCTKKKVSLDYLREPAHRRSPEGSFRHLWGFF